MLQVVEHRHHITLPAKPGIRTAPTASSKDGQGTKPAAGWYDSRCPHIASWAIRSRRMAQLVLLNHGFYSKKGRAGARPYAVAAVVPASLIFDQRGRT